MRAAHRLTAPPPSPSEQARTVLDVTPVARGPCFPLSLGEQTASVQEEALAVRMERRLAFLLRGVPGPAASQARAAGSSVVDRAKRRVTASRAAAASAAAELEAVCASLEAHRAALPWDATGSAFTVLVTYGRADMTLLLWARRCLGDESEGAPSVGTRSNSIINGSGSGGAGVGQAEWAERGAAAVEAAVAAGAEPEEALSDLVDAVAARMAQLGARRAERGGGGSRRRRGRGGNQRGAGADLVAASSARAAAAAVAAAEDAEYAALERLEQTTTWVLGHLEEHSADWVSATPRSVALP